MDDELVIRPKRELRLPAMSDRAMVIGVIAAISVLLLVLLLLTW